MNPLLYVKLGLACAALLGSAYLGYSFEHSRFMVFKAEVETVAREQEAKVISIQKQQELVNKGITNGFQNQLRTVRNYYGNGMLNASSGKLPTLSNPTGGSNEGTAYYELAGACAETTLQTLALQQWIRESAALK
jgi:hypothetical protein